MLVCQPIHLQPKQSLVRVEREPHARKRGAYVVRDRHGQFLLVSQKLALIAAFLNQVAEHAGERVSVPGLYLNVGRTSNGVQGYCKHRWRIEFHPLEHAGAAFEAARAEYAHAVVLGAKDAYRVASTA